MTPIEAAPLIPVEPVPRESVSLSTVSASEAPPSDTMPSAYEVDPSLLGASKDARDSAATLGARTTLPFGPSLPSEGSRAARLALEENTGPRASTPAVAAAPAVLQGPTEFGPPEVSAPTATSPESRPRIAASAPLSTQAASDAPVVNSWLPPPTAGNLRRLAPLGAGLVAVMIAFFVGIKVGRVSSPAPAAARITANAPDAPLAPIEKTSLASAPAHAAPTPGVAKGASTDGENRAPATSTPETDALTAVAHVPAGKGGGRFSVKAAYSALNAVATRARACKKPGTSAGSATALVTFGPSGRVEDVTVSGAKVAGTPTATCIASALNTARMPAFSGKAQTIKRNIKLE
jgi:hypothetical protein